MPQDTSSRDARAVLSDLEARWRSACNPVAAEAGLAPEATQRHLRTVCIVAVPESAANPKEMMLAALKACGLSLQPGDDVIPIFQSDAVQSTPRVVSCFVMVEERPAERSER